MSRLSLLLTLLLIATPAFAQDPATPPEAAPAADAEGDTPDEMAPDEAAPEGEDPDEAAPEEEGPKDPEAKEVEALKWQLTFTNGDTLHGQLKSLEGDQLVFTSSIAPTSSMTISVAQIDSAGREEQGEEGEEGETPITEGEGGLMLWLHDGSVMRGQLLKLLPDSIEFEVEGIGPLRFSRALASEIANPSINTGTERAEFEGEGFLLTTSKGDTLMGDVTQAEDGQLEVASETLKARVKLESLARLVFPRAKTQGAEAEPEPEDEGTSSEDEEEMEGPIIILEEEVEVTKGDPKGGDDDGDDEGDEEGGADDGGDEDGEPEMMGEGAGDKTDAEGAEPAPQVEEGVRVRLAFANGTLLFGIAPRLSNGVLEFSLEYGQRVKVDIDRVTRISFESGSANIGQRRILLWTCYADTEGELVNTRDALESQMRGWKLVENDSADFDTDFKRELMRSSVLVIPEPERWGPDDPSALAKRFREVTREFLRRGGKVVFVGFDSGPTSFVRETELLPVQKVGDSSGAAVKFTRAGKRIGRDIGETFESINATFTYSIDDGKRVISFAETPTGESVVLGRRIGQGWAMMIGMDYYIHNEEVDKVLANVIRMR